MTDLRDHPALTCDDCRGECVVEYAEPAPYPAIEPWFRTETCAGCGGKGYHEEVDCGGCGDTTSIHEAGATLTNDALLCIGCAREVAA